MITKEQIIEVAKTCFDPEIPVNIWDLGLIYDIDIHPDTQAVNIKMSLTSPSCPAAQSLPEDLKTKVMNTLKLQNVAIQIVFDPPWTPEKISDEGKKRLGLLEE